MLPKNVVLFVNEYNLLLLCKATSRWVCEAVLLDRQCFSLNEIQVLTNVMQWRSSIFGPCNRRRTRRNALPAVQCRSLPPEETPNGSVGSCLCGTAVTRPVDEAWTRHESDLCCRMWCRNFPTLEKWHLELGMILLQVQVWGKRRDWRSVIGEQPRQCQSLKSGLAIDLVCTGTYSRGTIPVVSSGTSTRY